MEATTYLGIDPDELDDVLTKIEQSYAITFTTNELREVDTFGQLCEAITEKIQRADVADCTSQQAFYQLRQSLISVLQVDRQTIRPTTELAVLFPKNTRRANLQSVEKQLGFGLNVLTPSLFVVIPAIVLFVASLFALFVNSLLGAAGLALALGTSTIAHKLARQFTVETVGDLAEKLAREHYTKVRRDASTVNKRELVDQIKQLFCADLGFVPEQLKPDSLIS